MSIEKMVLVNLRGDRKNLDECLWRLTSSGIFHPEQAPSVMETSYSALKKNTAENEGGKGQPGKQHEPVHQDFNFSTSLNEENPYLSYIKDLEQVAEAAEITLKYENFDDLDVTADKLHEYVEQTHKKVNDLMQKKQATQRIIPLHEQAMLHLSHLSSLDINFDDLFACEYLKIRFGRMPSESYGKLKFYNHKPFVFLSFDDDKEYCWCLYLTDEANRGEIDGLFASLFFERLRIPDYAHGTPERAIEIIRTDLTKEREKLADINSRLANFRNEEGKYINKIYSKLKFLADAFEMRKYASIVKKEFVLVGFIPEKDQKSFESLFTDINITVTYMPADSDARFKPPVKLKNNWFIRPYEMYVGMYGMPSYKDIDPTPFVAITYTLLFGIMFGDVGQGLLIALMGLFLGKKKKMPLGNIMTRMGLSSMVFGVLYGSVFGFEHLFNPMWKSLGFDFPHGKPIEVMAPESTNLILMTAVAMGAVIIVAAILMNIILGFKQKNYERAILSNNGLAGLVFYTSVLYAAVATLFLKKAVVTPLYIAVFFVLPLVIIFLKEPLGRLIEGKGNLFHEGIGSFIIESFFELFEVLLSFVTNTMSFLRVGGFILAHAGMMAVIFTLSSMVSGGASIAIIIIGNLFVIGLEGLIVGIQVLRLEFYEVFSRFFDGEGKPFEPVVANCNIDRA